MNFSENDNIYEFNAMNVLDRYAEFVEGAPECLVAVCSSEALGADVRHAISASCEKLGLGDCAWIASGGASSGDSRAPVANAAPEASADLGDNVLLAVNAATDGSVAEAPTAVDGPGASMSDLSGKDLLALIEGIDPVVLIAADEAAAGALGKAYDCRLALDAPSRVFGRTCVAFRDFESMLADSASKQRAWALLKQLK